MAVSKELLARYKELKAQGVSITLSELKAQMEAESNSKVAESDIQDRVQSESVVENQTNSYSFEQHKPEQSQNLGWTTSYSHPIVETPVATTTASVEDCSKNTLPQSVNNSSYENNFSGNFNWGAQPSQTELQSSQMSVAETSHQISYSSENMTFQVPKEENRLKKFCLIGYPLGHSLSTYIHNAGFKSLGINATYEILETPPDTLVDRIKFLKSNGFAGFNVTIPLKLPVTLFLDEVDMSADIVGAVNTVVINPDRTMKGYNTDVIGFRNAIPESVTLAGKVAGVLGTGGAARAAITALAQSQVKQIKIYTRNIPNCADLLAFLRKKFPYVEFNAFQIERIRDLSDINILVNTTPIGMQGRAADLTPVEENELRTLPPNAIVYDVIYNPKKTKLLKLAQKWGYRTINGVDMFIHQALVAEQIWTGQTPDFKDMKIAALENL